MWIKKKNRILECRAAGYIADLPGVCTHLDMLASVKRYG